LIDRRSRWPRRVPYLALSSLESHHADVGRPRSTLLTGKAISTSRMIRRAAVGVDAAVSGHSS